jgi:hypothetical protein
MDHKSIMKNLNHTLSILCLFTLIYSIGCRSQRSDPDKITKRPRVFVENSAPVPIIDEYDFKGVQIGTIDNIFTEDPSDRSFALWFTLDRRSSITLQKESIRRRGQTLQLIVDGRLVGFSVLEKAITNGVIPFFLINMPEENAMILHRELAQSITHLQAQLKEQQ